MDIRGEQKHRHELRRRARTRRAILAKKSEFSMVGGRAIPVSRKAQVKAVPK